MAPIFIVLFPFLAVLIGFVIARSRANPAAINTTEPTCGKCGYVVRGLTTFTCPECGSDLRDVGIIAPGSRKPLSRKVKLVLWTVFAFAPGIVLGTVVGQSLAPWKATTSRQRFVFIQDTALNQAIFIKQDGAIRTFGRPGMTVKVPLQSMTLSLTNQTVGAKTLAVDLTTPRRMATYTDPSGKVITDALNALFIESWMRANGLNDPTLPARSSDVLASIDEMNDGGGQKFSRFGFDPQRGNVPAVTAHPASSPFTVPQTTPWTNVVPFGIAILFWLIGVPFALRRPRPTPAAARTIAVDANQE